jgi:peptidoglycan/xylan/chitin deacetylase (PgdA/CDA1 family)
MFRLDRFLTLYFFHPLGKRSPSSEIKIPILMYHGISSLQKKGCHPYYETSTRPVVFAMHMAFLKENGYSVVGLDDLKYTFSNNASHGDKKVVITFDDGLADFYENGYPVLKQYDYSATVYLPAGMMGQELNGQACMTWTQVRDLMAAGICFGSHSMTHSKLNAIDSNELIKEIGHSKALIEAETGKPVESFSYPYAFPEASKVFLQRYEKILAVKGYRTGVTTIIGNSSNRDNIYFLKRLPVNDYDDAAFFAAKLQGGYDWVHTLQVLYKKTKRD